MDEVRVERGPADRPDPSSRYVAPRVARPRPEAGTRGIGPPRGQGRAHRPRPIRPAAAGRRGRGRGTAAHRGPSAEADPTGRGPRAPRWPMARRRPPGSTMSLGGAMSSALRERRLGPDRLEPAQHRPRVAGTEVHDLDHRSVPLLLGTSSSADARLGSGSQRLTEGSGQRLRTALDEVMGDRGAAHLEMDRRARSRARGSRRSAAIARATGSPRSVRRGGRRRTTGPPDRRRRGRAPRPSGADVAVALDGARARRARRRWRVPGPGRVLDRVMLVDVDVAGGMHLEVDEGVLGKSASRWSRKPIGVSRRRGRCRRGRFGRAPRSRPWCARRSRCAS